MAKKYKSILFWFDGLFTSKIASLTLAELKPNLSTNETITYREKLQQLVDELTIGKIDPQEYCRQANQITETAISSEELIQAVINKADLNQPFFEIYTQILPENNPGVVVDIPRVWFDQLIVKWKVADHFHEDRLIFTETFKLKNIYPDIFYFIPQAAGLKMEDCIMVDPQQMRAVAAHKLGLSSATYTYPRRMKIDLAIQGIWKTGDDVVHPKGGGRPNL
jgi:hypothetical protein